MKIIGRNNGNKENAMFVVCENKIYLCITALFFILSGSLSAQQATVNRNPNSITNSGIKNAEEYSFKIIELQDKTFGYDIYQKGRLLIHQPSIPATAGSSGFLESVSAQRIARLVIYKLNNGEMPPSITSEDLRKLNAI